MQQSQSQSQSHPKWQQQQSQPHYDYVLDRIIDMRSISNNNNNSNTASNNSNSNNSINSGKSIRIRRFFRCCWKGNVIPSVSWEKESALRFAASHIAEYLSLSAEQQHQLRLTVDNQLAATAPKPQILSIDDILEGKYNSDTDTDTIISASELGLESESESESGSASVSVSKSAATAVDNSESESESEILSVSSELDLDDTSESSINTNINRNKFKRRAAGSLVQSIPTIARSNSPTKFLVSAILDRRIVQPRNRKYYYVEWANTSEYSWEPESNLIQCNELIEEYEYREREREYRELRSIQLSELIQPQSNYRTSPQPFTDSLSIDLEMIEYGLKQQQDRLNNSKSTESTASIVESKSNNQSVPIATIDNNSVESASASDSNTVPAQSISPPVSASVVESVPESSSIELLSSESATETATATATEPAEPTSATKIGIDADVDVSSIETELNPVPVPAAATVTVIETQSDGNTANAAAAAAADADAAVVVAVAAVEPALIDSKTDSNPTNTVSQTVTDNSTNYCPIVLIRSHRRYNSGYRYSVLFESIEIHSDNQNSKKKIEIIKPNRCTWLVEQQLIQHNAKLLLQAYQQENGLKVID